MVQAAPRLVSVQGVELEIQERGAGPTVLFLHGDDGIASAVPFLELLAKRARVLAPSHPGFGHSSLPSTFDTVDDIAYLYLDLIEQLGLRDVILVGSGFGGWIAAEMAVKCCHRLSRLVLVDPVGAKFGDRETRDIADIYSLSAEEVARRRFHDQAYTSGDVSGLSDDELTIVARNRQSLVLYGWLPYMHDPKLRQRLHRIDVPTLLLWGESDGIVTPDYGRAFCVEMPGAHLELIAAAGHAPEVEQPPVVVERIMAFLK